MAFHVVFADYLEYSSTHDSTVDIVADIHSGDPSQLVRISGVTFSVYKNYVVFIPYFKSSLAMPELILE